MPVIKALECSQLQSQLQTSTMWNVMSLRCFRILTKDEHTYSASGTDADRTKTTYKSRWILKCRSKTNKTDKRKEGMVCDNAQADGM